MCSKCDEIIATIARYRRLKTQITDQQMNEAAARQLTELEADKLALHPKSRAATIGDVFRLRNDRR